MTDMEVIISAATQDELGFIGVGSNHGNACDFVKNDESVKNPGGGGNNFPNE